MTNVYLAGTKSLRRQFYDSGYLDRIRPPFVLESYHYLKDWQMDVLEPLPTKFMLDSGAFTYMRGTEDSNIDWEAYVDDYAETVRRYDVDRFMGVDIDTLVGTARVRELRDRLERKAGRDCIPIWHKFRGREAFLDLCERYDYVALGGIGRGKGNEIPHSDHRFFPWFIEKAHERDAKIHALGMTSIDLLHRYDFDSVDSKSWKMCWTGATYEFNGRTLKKNQTENRVEDYDSLYQHNFREWARFGRRMTNEEIPT